MSGTLYHDYIELIRQVLKCIVIGRSGLRTCKYIGTCMLVQHAKNGNITTLNCTFRKKNLSPDDRYEIRD